MRYVPRNTVSCRPSSGIASAPATNRPNTVVQKAQRGRSNIAAPSASTPVTTPLKAGSRSSRTCTTSSSGWASNRGATATSPSSASPTTAPRRGRPRSRSRRTSGRSCPSAASATCTATRSTTARYTPRRSPSSRTTTSSWAMISASPAPTGGAPRGPGTRRRCSPASTPASPSPSRRNRRATWGARSRATTAIPSGSSATTSSNGRRSRSPSSWSTACRTGT